MNAQSTPFGQWTLRYKLNLQNLLTASKGVKNCACVYNNNFIHTLTD